MNLLIDVGVVRKGFGQWPLKDVTMERKRVEEFEESLRWRLWMNQSCFSLRFLSQNSLWKLSTFRGYKGLYIVVCVWNTKSQFFKLELASGLTSRLDWVASSSRELTERPGWTFCPVVLQLVWLFIFSARFTRVLQLVVCQSRVSHESLHPCTILSISSHSLTHYPYMIFT